MEKERINQLIEKAKELEASKHLDKLLDLTSEEVIQPATKPVVPYVPQTGRLTRLSEVNEGMVDKIKSVSPFLVSTFNNLSDNWEHFIQRFYKIFDTKQMARMSYETRMTVIQHGKIGFKKLLRRVRGTIFPLRYMFTEMYEEKRFDYLINYDREPILLTEEDYNYVESIFLEAFETLSLNYFALDGVNVATGHKLTKDVSDESVITMATTAVRRFPYLGDYTMKKLHECFVNNLRRIDSHFIFENYQEYTLKPLSFHVVIEGEDGTLKFYDDSLSKLERISRDLRYLKKLGDNQEVYLLCAGMVKIVEMFEEALRNEEKMNASISTKKSVWLLSSRLPTIIEVLSDLVQVETVEH